MFLYVIGAIEFLDHPLLGCHGPFTHLSQLQAPYAGPPMQAPVLFVPPRFYNSVADHPSYDQQSLTSTFSMITLNPP